MASSFSCSHHKFFRFSCHHITDNPYCMRYQSNLHETSLHVLRDCSVLGDFWYRLVTPTDWPNFFSSDLRKWLLDNLKGVHPSNGCAWSHVFASAIHFLWQTRNEEVFQRITLSPEALFQRFWAVFHGRKVENFFGVWGASSSSPFNSFSVDYVQ